MDTTKTNTNCSCVCGGGPEKADEADAFFDEFVRRAHPSFPQEKTPNQDPFNNFFGGVFREPKPQAGRSTGEYGDRFVERGPWDYQIRVPLGNGAKPEEITLKLKGQILTLDYKHKLVNKNSGSKPSKLARFKWGLSLSASRNLSINFTIPEHVDVDKMESVLLAPKGVLKVRAPYKPKDEGKGQYGGASAGWHFGGGAAAGGPSLDPSLISIPITVVGEKAPSSG